MKKIPRFRKFRAGERIGTKHLRNQLGGDGFLNKIRIIVLNFFQAILGSTENVTQEKENEISDDKKISNYNKPDFDTQILNEENFFEPQILNSSTSKKSKKNKTFAEMFSYLTEMFKPKKNVYEDANYFQS